MSWSDWLSLAAVCALGAMSPGPSLAVVVRSTLAGGRAAGVVAGLAHALGIGCYALTVALGLAAIATAPRVLIVLQVAGAAFLAWLGWQALRGDGGAFGTEPAARDGAKLARAARDGFLIAFLNPKIALWFLALFAQFVDPGMTIQIKLAMAGLAAAIDGSWYVLAALALSTPAVLARLRRHARWIDRLFGVLLLALAMRLAVALAIGA